MTTPYNWADDSAAFVEPSFPPSQQARAAWGAGQDTPPRQDLPPRPQEPPRTSGRATRAASAAGAAAGGFVGGMTSGFVPPLTVNVNGRGGRGGGNGTARGFAPGSPPADRHQGDQMIYAIERIEFRSDKDIIALTRAINHLGRELTLILGMRAEEVQGVLSQYKGKWYTFGASSRVKAMFVAAHLKVAAEAAKALGVAAVKAGYALDRHFIKPEQEAKRRRNGQKAKPRFTIGDD